MNTITPHYRTIQQLLGTRSFKIDDYQREYKWSKDNVDELLTDLLEKFYSCYHEGHPTTQVAAYGDYFLGSIIVSRRDDGDYLIDGQQRVTTLTLLLIYLLHAAEDKQLPVHNTLRPLIYSDNLGTPSFNLAVPERLEVINALFQRQSFSAVNGDESVKNICNRYGELEVRDLAGELNSSLPHFIYWLITKVGLIEIVTDNDEYAYAIFEAMNDRGMRLSPVDMRKAYLIAPIAGPEQRHLANQTWKQQVQRLVPDDSDRTRERDVHCIKAWLRAQYAESIRDRKPNAPNQDWELIGTEFARWTRRNRRRLDLGDPPQPARHLYWIRNEFPFFATAYQRMMEAGAKYTQGLEAVFYNAHNEFTWQNTVALASLCPADDEETVRRKLAATAIYLDIWLMRRVINYVRVSYSSASYAMYLLCKDIRRTSLPDLVHTLKARLDADDVTFDGSPSHGRNGIRDLRLNQFTGRYIFHLLARLTAYIEKGSGRADLFDKYVDRRVPNPFDIEHIWAADYSRFAAVFPNPDDFWWRRDHISGLLLLPADVNRSLQAKPYEDKLSAYGSENLLAASLTDAEYSNKPKFRSFCTAMGLNFKPYAHFGKDEQHERAAVIYKLVKLVWSPDRLTELL